MYERVISRVNQSCHICISHVTYLNEWCYRGRAALDLNGSYHVWKSHITYKWVISHMNNSWHVYERVMSLRTPRSKWVVSCVHESLWRVVPHIIQSCHIWIGHVTYSKDSCHRGRAVLGLNGYYHVWVSHVWTSHITLTSHVTYEYVMSHIWMSHVTGDAQFYI